MRAVKVLVVFLAVVAVMAIAIWRWNLGAPNWGDWHGMELTHKTELWPATSHYYIFRNYMSVSFSGVDKRSDWLDCAFWNGNGIDSVVIYAVRGSDTVLVYPGEEASQSLSGQGDGEILAFSASVSGPEFAIGNPRCDVNLSPNIEDLYIILYDSHGNIASQSVHVPLKVDPDKTA